MKTTKKETLPDENTQKILNEITQNLFESITALTDATTLLSKNPETKKYLEDNEKLENEINSALDVEESNRRFDIKIPYEQAIGITAFLTGFKLSNDLNNFIKDKDFVQKTLKQLYS
ncbi:hypothetical protein FL857_06055 [Criibacterium bergeronii]|uniref:Uncharacterized protein n=1 Tax=Criibacterium bergeronii TaxID=1871336 RepID=A0A552V724_9FIRM|nr:hypothetical protein [Criibacterium bergeronii]TRW26248.1 hypothetical protein FL857_06055 [Criibacterium bergeronii]